MDSLFNKEKVIRPHPSTEKNSSDNLLLEEKANQGHTLLGDTPKPVLKEDEEIIDEIYKKSLLDKSINKEYLKIIEDMVFKKPDEEIIEAIRNENISKEIISKI